MEKKETERIAVLEEQVKQLVYSINNLSVDLRNWQSNYVPRQEIDERFKNVSADIQELRDELKDAATSKDINEIKEALTDMKNDKRGNKALYAAWAGVVTSGLAVVVAIIAIVTK